VHDDFKQAAASKIARMTESALKLFEHDSSREMRSSNLSNALIAFTQLREKSEEIGSVLWTYKKIITKGLYIEEGIQLHARLLATLTCQIMVAAFILTYGLLLAWRAWNGLYFFPHFIEAGILQPAMKGLQRVNQTLIEYNQIVETQISTCSQSQTSGNIINQTSDGIISARLAMEEAVAQNHHSIFCS